MAIKTKRFINSTKNCSCSMTGVWRACAYCQGVVVIFHSPKACSHVARRMDLSSYYYSMGGGIREQNALIPVVSSQLEEKHSIFGGGERLQDCIRYAVRTYEPECIMVANSCVAGVIGDDVPSICEEMEAELKLPVLTIDCYGFLDGEYYKGYYDTAKLFVKRFMKPCCKEKNTALLLGDSGGTKGDYSLYATEKLQALGLKVIGQFPGFTSFKELPQLARAEYLVLLGRPGGHDNGLSDLATYMAEALHMQFVPNQYPLGLKSSEEWLRSWGRLLARETAAEELIAAERQILDQEIKKYIPVCKNKKVVFGMGRLLRYFHPGDLLEMLRLLQVDLRAVVLIDAYDVKEKAAVVELMKSLVEAPIYDLTDSRAETALAEAELVLTTHELQLGEKKQIFVPMIPKVGVKGLLSFMDVIYRLLCSKISTEGVTYVRN